MNVMNAYTAERLKMPYCPSVELTVGEIARLPGEKELIVYGRLPLMQLRHCPLSARMGQSPHADCHRCDGAGARLSDFTLFDRKGVAFPLRRLKTETGCVVLLYNSVPLFLLRKYDKLPAAARHRVILTDESETRSRDIVTLHRAALDGADFRSHPAFLTQEALMTTTGHYFRGVE